jgi:hypothetical protein
LGTARKFSNTALGDQLRDYVIEILEADGRSISREQRVDTKKIDIILRLDDDFVTQTIAIECKNVSRNLNQQDIGEIYVDHLSLIETKKIDQLWIISKQDYSPEAKNWANQRANLSIFTIAEFEERAHGFRRYVRQLMEVFNEEDLNHYYIQQRGLGGGKLIDSVISWIDSDENRPLALLGGYGMGKTSFCRYLVSEISKKYLADAVNRVPIYVRLSDISKQQDLDGLIAKTIAQRYRIKDYYFEKFLRFNKNGKFVVIFDGFDEMKHALNWADFKYNFSQINSIVKGKAKIIVAGRPNAFLSDDEHNWVLRGMRSTGEYAANIADWPKYIEIEMQYFSMEDARLFLKLYLENHCRNRSVDGTIHDNQKSWIKGRLFEFSQLKIREDLFRPVHLKIFSDIATDETVTLREFNVFELYSVSTSRIAERESLKVERSFIDSAVRQAAIEEIAWWLWEKTNGRSLSFNPREVPPSYIKQAFPANTDISVEAMYREIFSGSFVERKFGENYYFSHRSFLEFFVSKKLARSRSSGMTLTQINSNINPEILDFIIQGRLIDDFMGYIYDLMQISSAEIEVYLLVQICAYINEKGIDLRKSQTAAGMLLRYAFLYIDNVDYGGGEDITKLLSDDFNSEVSEKRETALVFAADFVRSNTGTTAAKSVAEVIIRKCLESVEWKYWYYKQTEVATFPKLSFSRKNLFEFIILRNARIAAESSVSGRPIIIVDFDKFYNDVINIRPPRLSPAGRIPIDRSNVNSYRFEFDHVMSGIKQSSHGHALDVIRRGVAARIGV